MKETGKTGKWMAGVLAVVMAAGLAACGGDGKDDGAFPAGASSAAPSVSDTASASVSPETVSVEAADFEWKLGKTEFQAGQPIVFRLNGKEGRHGFSIVGTDVSQPIKAGETTEVTWTPVKPGEYIIKCNIMCGSGHREMETKITVK